MALAWSKPVAQAALLVELECFDLPQPVQAELVEALHNSQQWQLRKAEQIDI